MYTMSGTNWFVDDKGLLTLNCGEDRAISGQPAACLIAGGALQRPLAARAEGDRLILAYECGEAALRVEDKKEYLKLTALSVPEGAGVLVFGPYLTTKTSYGGLLGAAWDEAQNAVCIQSLNPKTVGGFPAAFETLHPCYGQTRLPEFSRDSLTSSAAVPVEGGAALQCYAQDMSAPATHQVGIGPVCGDAGPGAGVSGAEACEVPGEDAFIPGAAIALIACPRDELLGIIGRLELQEGLPHPTIDGEWAKTAPRASEAYMMIWGSEEDITFEETLEYIRKAGLHCYYNWKPFVSWGHFEIDPKQFPGGDEGLKKAVDRAAEKGEMFGFHTLSNFINTDDPYVTPVPSEDLLIMDTTTLAEALGGDDTAMYVAEPKNYFAKSHLNCVRVGRELIQYDVCEAAGGAWRLTNLTRGAFGTAAAAHEKGEKVFRLQDHGYLTLFPNLKMQREMATRLGELIKKTGVRRMSFDGLEGCLYTGRGEYACSEYVRRVFEIAGSELICDASTPSHYRWHAHTYFNWGEPYYDWEGRGGMFRYRLTNQEYFADNMMHHMLGQYTLRLSTPKFEATHPENFEFMLAQSIANDAGYGLDVKAKVLKNYGLTDYLLSLIRTWQDMRFNGVIPDSLREAMKDENADWHLEETEGGWTVYRIRKQVYDFGYVTKEPYGPANHAVRILIDKPVPSAPLNMRIRVGKKRDGGEMTYMAFHHGGYGYFPTLKFEGFSAAAGDYLIYTGGTTIAHYDADYRLLETIQGEGEPVVTRGFLDGFTLHYAISEGSAIEPYGTIFQSAGTVFVPRREGADG